MRPRSLRATALTLGLMLVAGGLLAAGCASAPAPGTDAGAAVDPQLLIGRWQGQWQTDLERGPAYLDIREIQGRTVFGRLYLENYGGHIGGAGVQDSPITGTVTARAGRLRLVLTSGPLPMELTIAGTAMGGTMISGASPSTATTLSLQQVSGHGPPPVK